MIHRRALHLDIIIGCLARKLVAIVNVFRIVQYVVVRLLIHHLLRGLHIAQVRCVLVILVPGRHRRTILPILLQVILLEGCRRHRRAVVWVEDVACFHHLYLMKYVQIYIRSRLECTNLIMLL